MNMKLMYGLPTLYFGKKRAMLLSMSRSRLWSELAGILLEMERQNTMEECLRVFQARLHVFCFCFFVLVEGGGGGVRCSLADKIVGWFHATRQ